tara:strand:+ start:211 stop:864 length:654 start_codon:yes stop_codon:yes gene_type:complete
LIAAIQSLDLLLSYLTLALHNTIILIITSSISTPSTNYNTGTATVDADYNIDSKVANFNAKWGKEGLEIACAGNSVDKITEVSASTEQELNGNKWNIGAAYNMLKKTVSGSTDLTVDDTTVTLTYDTCDKDPVLNVDHKLDDNNSVSPTMSLKSGDMSYGWTRKINGGKFGSRLFPGDRVDLTWEDEGASGVWTTKAEVPLDNAANSKISFSRDWNY